MKILKQNNLKELRKTRKCIMKMVNMSYSDVVTRDPSPPKSPPLFSPSSVMSPNPPPPLAPDSLSCSFLIVALSLPTSSLSACCSAEKKNGLLGTSEV